MTPDDQEQGAIRDVEHVLQFSRASVAMVLTNPRLEDNPIVYVNSAFEALTGYDSSVVIGQNCRFLQGEGSETDALKKLRKAIGECAEVSVELTNYRADGSEFRNALIISPILSEDDDCDYFLGIQRAVDGDQDAPADDMLMELQHRVKNHLSMIISMIRTQLRSSTAPEEFGALSRRIESLQLLYEEMSNARRGNTEKVPLGTYLSRIANSIAHIDGRPGIRCSISMEKFSASVEVATRLGLVFSEVLTNAFQHAFEGREEGQIDVRMVALTDGGLRLTVTDDGTGLPDDVNWPNPATLGGRIVDGLIEGLQGTLLVSPGAAGTIVTIDVPMGTESEE